MKPRQALVGQILSGRNQLPRFLAKGEPHQGGVSRCSVQSQKPRGDGISITTRPPFWAPARRDPGARRAAAGAPVRHRGRTRKHCPRSSTQRARRASTRIHAAETRRRGRRTDPGLADVSDVEYAAGLEAGAGPGCVSRQGRQNLITRPYHHRPHLVAIHSIQYKERAQYVFHLTHNKCHPSVFVTKCREHVFLSKHRGFRGNTVIKKRFHRSVFLRQLIIVAACPAQVRVLDDVARWSRAARRRFDCSRASSRAVNARSSDPAR